MASSSNFNLFNSLFLVSRSLFFTIPAMSSHLFFTLIITKGVRSGLNFFLALFSQLLKMSKLLQWSSICLRTYSTWSSKWPFPVTVNSFNSLFLVSRSFFFTIPAMSPHLFFTSIITKGVLGNFKLAAKKFERTFSENKTEINTNNWAHVFYYLINYLVFTVLIY